MQVKKAKPVKLNENLQKEYTKLNKDMKKCEKEKTAVY